MTEAAGAGDADDDAVERAIARAALHRVRRLIARAVLADDEDACVGDVTLHVHQRQALARVNELLSREGVALLADQTGLGKTFVALAAARRYERVLIVAPASLRDLWARALTRTRVRAEFVSLELLSRQGRADVVNGADLVIVDEAHHLRNVLTRRYAAVAALCDCAAALLLSATPIQNRRDDLAAQLALRIGDAAWTMTDDELARFVVRRTSRVTVARLPTLDGPHWIPLPVEDDLLDALLALPPPLPGSDEGTGGELVVYTLLRQWASSRAALVAALHRRVGRATAMIASLESGRWPTRRELLSWTCAEGTVQLALPELLSAGGDMGVATLSGLLDAVRVHESALRALLDGLRATRDPDLARVEALRWIRGRHGGHRVIAFSQYAETVSALARLITPDGGVAQLTARGARIASGRVTRAEVLAQFAPQAHVIHPTAADRITMLIATDVLSEGLDLQAASVIVHLDLPWNPARLEQRVGRVLRIGSSHETVWAYALSPPASSERVLRAERRLRVKLRVARAVIGLGAAALPFDADDQGGSGAAEITSEMHASLACWRDDPQDVETFAARAGDRGDAGEAGEAGARLEYAAVLAERVGFLALVDDPGGPALVAAEGDGITTDAAYVRDGVYALAGEPVVAREAEIAWALDSIDRWWLARRGRRALGLTSTGGARVRARIAAHVAALVSAAPRHDRARLAALASRASVATRAPLGAFAERSLAELAQARVRDEQWLRAIAALGACDSARGGGVDGCDVPAQSRAPVIALVILRHRDHSAAC